MKKNKKVSKVDKKKILKKKTVKKKNKVVKKKTSVKKTPKKKQVKKIVKKTKEVKKFVEPKLPPQSDKKVNNRIINPAHYQAKKVKKFLEIKTIKEKKVKKIFNTKDHVVYPTHGVGQVIDIEKREVVGQKLEMYVIEFVRDKLILRVPVEKAKSLNLRKVSKPSKIQTVLKILSQKPKIKRTMWSRRAQEYDLKINSGDIEQIAEVVRDLTHAQINKGISPALKRMLAKARTTLASEIACALSIDEEAAVEKINQYLPEEDPDDGL